MAEVIRAQPALHDLDAIADYIAPDNPQARPLGQKIFEHIDHLQSHPQAWLKTARDSKVGVIAKSSSRRVVSFTEKIRDEF